MPSTAREAVRLSPNPYNHDEHAAPEWQQHLAAARLPAATGPGTTPAIAANRARTEAIVGAHAAAVRAADRAGEVWEAR